MNVVAIVQKPLDVLNALEFCNQLRIDVRNEVSWLVIGKGRRQAQTMALLRDGGMKARFLFNPDLLSYERVLKLVTPRALPFRRVLQLCILPAAVLLWHAAIAVQARQLRKRTGVDLIIYDAWRTKLFTLLALPRAPHCIVDDGSGSIGYSLLHAFEQGGAVRLFTLSLFAQKRLLPARWLRAAILRKVDPDALFFSAYWDEGTRVPRAMRNDYRLFGAKLRTKQRADVALVLGFPGFRKALESCQFALHWLQQEGAATSTTSISYRAHPIDVSTKSPEEMRVLVNRISAALGVQVNAEVSKFELEFDLLIMPEVPKVVFGYRSSARVALGQCEDIRWVDLPNLFQRWEPIVPLE